MSVADDVDREAKRDAKRRGLARTLGGLAQAAIIPIDRDIAARVMIVAGPATPGEAIDMIKRRWPSTWERIVVLARRRREPPGSVMIAMIESALSAEGMSCER